MDHHKQERKKQLGALMSSIGLHSLLLLGAYYFLFKTTTSYRATAYRVKVSNYPIQEEVSMPAQEVPSPEPSADKPTKNPIATSPISKVEPPQVDQKQEAPTPQVLPTPEETNPAPPLLEEGLAKDAKEGTDQQSAIDERSLYQDDSGKQTGASLELVGWVWDSVPRPQDDTAETGKLVFEITIDDLGEIVAVKTLEKTVSPLVEQIYKDAVAKLTFTKATQNQAYASRSVGKVTFIIQAK
jgi:protein TonB